MTFWAARSALVKPQMSPGLRFSGQAKRLQSLHSQHKSDHWLQGLRSAAENSRLRMTLCGWMS